MTPIVAPYEGPPLRVVDRDVIDDVVTEVEIVWIVDLVCLEQTVLVVCLVDVAEVDVPCHLLPPFMVMMRNSHPSLLVAISPWGFDAS